MPRFGSLQKFFGKTVSDSASYAAGTATGNALTPYLQEVINTAWTEHQSLPIEPDAAAEIVAEDYWDETVGIHEANKSGIDGDKFAALAESKRAVPGFDQVMRMFRRGTVSLETLHESFRKRRFSFNWDAALEDLQHEKLDPSIVADAIVRGVIPAPFSVPFNPPGTGGKVPAYPTSPIDPVEEIKDSGYNLEQLALMTAIGGRPMSPVDAAQSVFRGIIERVDYDRAIAEGDIRPEYSEAQFEHTRQILTASEYVEAFLRNWIKEADMRAGAAKHGMTPDDADLLAKLSGRPLSFHQVHIGLARGGVYNGGDAGIDPAFLKSLQESNIRPEWYNLAWAQRYTYPSFFVLRLMAETGELTEADLHQILLYIGWEPTLAQKVAQRIAAGGGAASKEATATDLLTLWDGGKLTTAETHAALVALGYPADEAQRRMDVVEARRVASATNTVISDLHTSYKKGELSVAKTVAALEQLGVSTEGADRIEQTWRVFLTASGTHPPT